MLFRSQEVRLQRAQAIANCLKKLGINDSYQGAAQLAKANNISRSHFASYLLQQGHIKDYNQAFKRYLGRGKPAYVAAPWASISQVIMWIHEANGAAVLAHPTRYALTRRRLIDLVNDFKKAGGDGLEVVSASTALDEIQWLTQLCCNLNLYASQGSDFHGPAFWAELGKLQSLPGRCQSIWQTWSRV